MSNHPFIKERICLPSQKTGNAKNVKKKKQQTTNYYQQHAIIFCIKHAPKEQTSRA